jgi:hypothetical protein
MATGPRIPAARAGAHASAPADPAAALLGPRTVAIARAEYEELRATAAAGSAARLEAALDEAIASERIAPARRSPWRAALEADEVSAKAALARITPGTAAAISATGRAPADQDRAMAAIRAAYGLPERTS